MAAIPISYLNQLPSDYKKAVKALNRKLTKSNSSAEKCRYLEAFTDKYTALPEIWEYWQRLVNYSSPEWNKIKEKQNKNFPEYAVRLDEWPTYYSDPPITYSNDENNSAKLHPHTKYAMDIILSLPHSELSAALEFYDENSPVPLTETMMVKYKAACELHQKIKDCDSSVDAEKYIEILKEANNEEYVIKNIEIQLYKYPWCQNLWLAYVQYLEFEKKDNNALLQVLQRYYRLFFNNKEMREKYQAKVEEFRQTSADEMAEFWIDSIKFEFDYYFIKDGKNIMEKVFNYEFTEKNYKAIYDVIKLYCKRYSYEDILVKAESIKESYVKDEPADISKQLVFGNNTKIQRFPFSKPINQYLCDKVGQQHLQKLYQTCKWFYCKYRYSLVHRLKIDSTGYDNNKICKHFYHNSVTIEIGRACTKEISLKRLWLTHSLKIEKISPLFTKSIVQNELKYLDINFVYIQFDDFKFLVSSRSLAKINLCCTIIYENYTDVPLENVIAEILHVRRISYTRSFITPETTEKLLGFKFKNKIEHLHITLDEDVPPLDTNNFFIFLQNNLAPNAYLAFLIFFGNGEPFYRDLKQLIETWKPESEKPFITR